VAGVLMTVTFVKKHSVGSLILKENSLYIVAIVFMPITFVKTFSSCLIFEDTSLYIVASVFMPVIFIKKSFSQKSEIKRHQLIHSGQCPYACNVCKKLSVRSLILKDTSLNIVASVLMP
jgi:hypothetical protein